MMMMWIQQGGFSHESARSLFAGKSWKSCFSPENGDAINDGDSDDHEKEPQVSLLVILSRITRRLWNICLLLQVESGEWWWWSFLSSLIILLELYFIHRKNIHRALELLSSWRRGSFPAKKSHSLPSSNFLIIIQPARAARGPEGPARWER